MSVCAASNGSGSRGGNVRHVQEARELQEQSKEKARWTLIAREHIARTLLETGFFHADDMAPFGIPEEHCNVIGSQIASFRNRKLMMAVGERKCQHKAANGRKAKIYRITDLGRKELAGVSAGVPSPQGTEGSHPALTGTSVHPGEQSRPPVDALAPVQADGPLPSPVHDGVDNTDEDSPVVPVSQAAGESRPTLFDASEGRECPLNPLVDQEAA